MTCALLLALLAPATEADAYRWCPVFPKPASVLVVPFAGDLEEGMLLETLAGIAARESLHGRCRTLLWEETSNEGYALPFRQYVEVHRPEVTQTDLDGALSRLADEGVVRGYILYRLDEGPRALHARGPMDVSANVATALAGQLGAVACSERLEPRLRALGLPRLLDARGMTEAQCLDEHEASFSRSVLCLADPRTRNVRSLAIALDAMVVSEPTETYLRALARCEPDSPILGWGCGGEDEITAPSSRAGLFQTATNWCHNLPLLASEGLEESGLLAAASSRVQAPASGEAGGSVANLTITDGDNIQWLMGNFDSGSEGASFFGHPRRGEIPFTWGLPGPGVAQLSPRWLAEVLRRASPNDSFVLYSGGGYFYPDVYGSDRPEAGALRLHARRLRAWRELLGIPALAFNFLDWDSAAAREACRTIAEENPGLPGILAFQYYPYSGGKGEVYWVEGAGGERVPVVSCRKAVWANTGRPDDAPPVDVARDLGSLAAEGPSASWVLVHAWSYFTPEGLSAPDSGSLAGSERGYGPALTLAEALRDGVRLVSAEELLARVRALGPR